MAYGRMIVNAITKDKRINQLSDDTSRLAFTWLITFADREGRTYGDPAIVRSMLFPRRDDVSIEQMAAYIREWHKLRLIIWYEVDDDWFIFFPAFDKNQPGIRKEREAASIMPPPPESTSEVTPELVQSNSGNDPEECRIKLKEIKLKEKKGKEETAAAIFSSFENNIQMLTPGSADIIDGWIKDYPDQYILDAIQEAVKYNKRNIAYIGAILKKWGADGRGAPKQSLTAEQLATEVY